MMRITIGLILFLAFFLDYSFFPQLTLNYPGYFLVLAILASLALLEESRFLWIWFFLVAFLWDAFSVLPRGVFLLSIFLLWAGVLIARLKIISEQWGFFAKIAFFIIFFWLFRLFFYCIVSIGNFFVKERQVLFSGEVFFLELICSGLFVVASSLVYLFFEKVFVFFEKDDQGLKL